MLQQCYGAFCFRFFLFNVCYFLKVLCCGRKEATEINIYSFLFVKNIYQLKKTNDYVKTIFISYQSEWRFYICYIISSQLYSVF